MTGEQQGNFHLLDAPQMVGQDTPTKEVKLCSWRRGLVSREGLWPRPQVMRTASPSE